MLGDGSVTAARTVVSAGASLLLADSSLRERPVEKERGPDNASSHWPAAAPAGSLRDAVCQVPKLYRNEPRTRGPLGLLKCFSEAEPSAGRTAIAR